VDARCASSFGQGVATPSLIRTCISSDSSLRRGQSANGRIDEARSWDGSLALTPRKPGIELRERLLARVGEVLRERRRESLSREGVQRGEVEETWSGRRCRRGG